jgi:hypothetical protein
MFSGTLGIPEFNNELRHPVLINLQTRCYIGSVLSSFELDRSQSLQHQRQANCFVLSYTSFVDCQTVLSTQFRNF